MYVGGSFGQLNYSAKLLERFHSNLDYQRSGNLPEYTHNWEDINN